MPELPEVETVINGIKPIILNQFISECHLFTKKLRYPVTPGLKRKLIRSSITSIARRAKYIIINLDNNNTLIIHLGMSGRIVISSDNEIKDFKHTHLKLKFSNNMVLKFIDPRRFGCIILIKSNDLAQHRLFNHLGLEPLENDFNGLYLFKICKNKSSTIKSVIMNQFYVVGVGNIYASEALYISKINPKTKGGALRLNDCKLLVKSIKAILRKSIKLGGSSISDYSMVNGKLGNYQNSLKVYAREGKNCLKKTCQGKILRIVIAQRSTFYCSHCQ